MRYIVTLVLASSLLALPALAADPPAAEPSLASRTFELRNLDVAEAKEMLREMTGLEDLQVDPASRTIQVRAAPASIGRVEGLLATLDVARDTGSVPTRVRVFRLEHLGVREAVTLLRSKMQATMVAFDEPRKRIAVRDTPERLAEAERLLGAADVAAR
jgi:type II secretory pathway component GspD/PulD (secretin)